VADRPRALEGARSGSIHRLIPIVDESHGCYLSSVHPEFARRADSIDRLAL